MEKNDINIINNLIFIIDKFNKNFNIKYLKKENNTLEDFVKNNGDYILETIDYILVYIDIYNKLDDLSIAGVEMINNNMYDPKYLELLIGIYDNNNYIVSNLLFNQKIVIYNNLKVCKKIIYKITKLFNIYFELMVINDKDKYNSCVAKLHKLFSDEEDDDDGGVPFDELLNQFSTTLKNVYGIKKKNVKVKVLKRY